MKSNKIYEVYKLLYKTYGPQGWWPFINYTSKYHPSDYTFPRDKNELFEVCLGSILTQNTTFNSVVKSLQNLNDLGCLNSEAIKNMDIDILKKTIKPSGYFNQKARYILEFIKFYDNLNGKIPSREELLKVIGIGEETADSILLYGYNQCEFKIDAYTKRLFLELGIINEKDKYKDAKYLVELELGKVMEDKEELRIVYQEFHALIVCHCKDYYSKKPYGVGCFLKQRIVK